MKKILIAALAVGMISSGAGGKSFTALSKKEFAVYQWIQETFDAEWTDAFVDPHSNKDGVFKVEVSTSDGGLCVTEVLVGDEWQVTKLGEGFGSKCTMFSN